MGRVRILLPILILIIALLVQGAIVAHASGLQYYGYYGATWYTYDDDEGVPGFSNIIFVGHDSSWSSETLHDYIDYNYNKGLKVIITLNDCFESGWTDTNQDCYTTEQRTAFLNNLKSQLGPDVAKVWAFYLFDEPDGNSLYVSNPDKVKEAIDLTKQIFPTVNTFIVFHNQWTPDFFNNNFITNPNLDLIGIDPYFLTKAREDSVIAGGGDPYACDALMKIYFDSNVKGPLYWIKSGGRYIDYASEDEINTALISDTGKKIIIVGQSFRAQSSSDGWGIANLPSTCQQKWYYDLANTDPDVMGLLWFIYETKTNYDSGNYYGLVGIGKHLPDMLAAQKSWGLETLCTNQEINPFCANNGVSYKNPDQAKCAGKTVTGQGGAGTSVCDAACGADQACNSFLPGANNCNDNCKAACQNNQTRACTAGNGCAGIQTLNNCIWGSCISQQNFCDNNCDGIQETCSSQPCTVCSCTGYDSIDCNTTQGCIGKRSCDAGSWSGVCEMLGFFCDANCDGTPETCSDKPCATCDCISPDSKSCYTGPAYTQNIGICKNGTKSCTLGQWGTACVGEVLPQTEVCSSDQKDENCNGVINENCECNNTETSICGTTDVGECNYGQKTCVGGHWQNCVGNIEPTTEICDINKKDENCDGTSNEGCECFAASDCVNQTCKNKACTANKCVYTNINATCPAANTINCGFAITPTNGCGSCSGTGTKQTCNDTNACTTDTCTNSQCTYTNINATCPAASTVNCGATITPTNGCGSCSGTGTKCASGQTCNAGTCTTTTTGGIINAASCSYADVSAAINSASSGDTVNVPAGTCTWNNQLVLTKGIILIGAGVGKTKITSNYDLPSGGTESPPGYLIAYDPATPRNNEPFRLSGFTIDFAGKSKGVLLYNNPGSSTIYPLTNIRIDHNDLKNPYGGDMLILTYGHVYGSVDNNNLTGSYFMFRNYGNDGASWASQTFAYGTANNIYFEDNNINCDLTLFVEGGAAGRYSFRHNNITSLEPYLQVFDAHGNTAASHSATMGIEVYDNLIYAPNVLAGGEIIQHRGGRALVYNNKVISPTAYDVNVDLREEAKDSDGPGPAFSPDGQPQHVSDSYYWSNKLGTSLSNAADISIDHYRIIEEINYGGTTGVVPQWDVDGWRQTTPFTGASGMGVGLFSARPSTCRIGVGYWATDQSRLYKCTATNTWTSYYTPFTYPHPFRTDCTNYPTLCDNSSGSTPPTSQCSAASDCANQTCKNKACNTGTCTYTDIAAVCPAANNTNCGIAITPTNGCGSCSGTGTKQTCNDTNACTTDTCTNSQCTYTNINATCPAASTINCGATITPTNNCGSCNGLGTLCNIAGQTCTNNVCVAACTDECTSGAKQCSGTTSFQTCGNYDTDSCTEWGGLTACTSGQTCNAGTCTTPSNGNIIDSSRRVDWSNAGVAGDIPYRTTICATLSPSGGNDAAAIQTAINNCAAGGVVKLNAGTFSINNGISVKSGVTLRGAGMGSTIIKNTVADISLVGFGAGGSLSTAKDITAGNTKGSTTITTSTAHGWNVGDIILIDQLEDPAGNPPISSTGAEGLCGWCSRDGGARPAGQVAKIISVPTTTTAVLELPLNKNFNKSPQAVKLNGVTSNAGVEDLTLDSSAAAADYNSGIFSDQFTENSWILRVEMKQIDRIGLSMSNTYRNTIRGCIIHDTLHLTSNGGYMLWMMMAGSSNLIEDNIFYNALTAIVYNGALSGNVFAYNYITKMSNSDYPTTVWPGIASHGAHSMMTLFEGNYIDGPVIWNDNVWGSSAYTTYFRNRQITNTAMLNTLYGLQVMKDNWYDNVVGNVFGTSGFETKYEGTDRYDMQAGIYYLEPADPNVKNTILRHGNWDSYNKATIWDSTITDHNIPSSLYLSSKPSWFGSLAWPPIGPDLSPINGTIPAKQRYDALMSGSTACTAADWSYSDGACQPSNTLIRTWVKTRDCQGGVSHTATENISCTYTQQCSDGTAYSQCSSTKPKYCSAGTLVNNCSQCGCLNGQSCQANGSCIITPQCTLASDCANQTCKTKACTSGTCTYTNTNASCPAASTINCGATIIPTNNCGSCTGTGTKQTCNDTNICTTDTCTNAQCVFTNINPICPAANNTNCGIAITPTNGCGSCSGTGTKCASGQTCNAGTCTTPTTGTINAASCSYADVTTAINSATAGTVINVPAGSCTWNSQLLIRKGVILKGAGIGNTIITSGYNSPNPGNTLDPANWLIVYYPSSPSLNEPFRFSGFTLDLNYKSNSIYFGNDAITAVNKVRIDHNKIINPYGGSIYVYGTVYGVIDNNTISGSSIILEGLGLQSSAWTYLTFDYGTADNMYFEDNVVLISNTPHGAAQGGRYCVRYNIYNTTGNLWPFCDSHGNQAMSDAYSAMGVEIYENTINAGSNGVGIVDLRGGRGIIFNNRVNTAGSVSQKARETDNDALTPPANDVISGQPQHVSDSYFWGNTKNGNTLVETDIDGQVDYGGSIGLVPRENIDFWDQGASFDGTTGIGVGLLSARPNTCTKGVAYWGTDTRRLYKCTATSTWASYYIPYPYPHPLRTDCTNYPTLCDNNSGSTPQCTTANDCANQTCKNKACNTGTCTYTDITAVCPTANNTNCGTTITPTNGCGTCTGTGTKCATGQTCNAGTCTTTTTGTINAASCSYADVTTAINSATAGTVINVPAGNCTWSSSLMITKGITLKGSGVNNTIITGNVGSGSFLVEYAPANPALNEPFRLSGFKWNLAGKSGWIDFSGSKTRVTKVRVDHNIVINPSLGDPSIGTTIQHSYGGEMYGVMDNNDLEISFVRIFGAESYGWTNYPFVFGSADQFYYEDNIFRLVNGGAGGFVQGEAGERYAFRHNTMNALMDQYALFDAHGNMGSGMNDGTMGLEIYDNIINANSHTIELIYHRGGMALVYNNTVISPSDAYIQIKEEYADSLNPPANSPITGESQHVGNSYYWNNLISPNTQIPLSITQTVSYASLGRNVPMENIDFWNYNPSFNGASGVGVGLFAARPNSCTIGVGYWARDTNTLYKCTTTNTWTSYYTPFTYPHPFRTDCTNYPTLCDNNSGSTQPQCTLASECANITCKNKACNSGTCTYTDITAVCPTANNTNCGIAITPTNGCGSCSGTGTKQTCNDTNICTTDNCNNAQCTYTTINPICPAANNTNCGATITPTNGCGTCTGTGTKCANTATPFCSANTCVACIQATDCANQTCKNKACNTGTCTYTDITAICPAANNTNCGATITPTNGCGTCTGTGTKCASGLICQNNVCAECTNGQTRQCGTTNFGECEYGTQTCTNGAWGSSCVGSINPTADICDGLDNDCDGSIDENFINKGLACSAGIGECARTGVYVCNSQKNSTVCNATAGTPSVEICDNKDNNCNDIIDENLVQSCYDGTAGTQGIGLCKAGTQACSAGIWSSCAGQIIPAIEICDANNNDENCNGAGNEGCTCTPGQTRACGTNNIGICKLGNQTCTNNATWGNCTGAINPTNEICDNLDNDCDSIKDDNLTNNSINKNGRCLNNSLICANGFWIVNSSNYAPQNETCNGIDDNCNSIVDEGLGNTTCGTGICLHTITNCIGGTSQTCNPTQGAANETCGDSLDNDCDGQIDEGCNCTEDWNCSEWSACSSNRQTRTCTDNNDCNTTTNKPSLAIVCSSGAETGGSTGGTSSSGTSSTSSKGGGGGGITPSKCIESWSCLTWSICEQDGFRRRSCADDKKCGTSINKPKELETCLYLGNCNDEKMNGNEEGIDCGGRCSKACQAASGESSLEISVEAVKGEVLDKVSMNVVLENKGGKELKDIDVRVDKWSEDSVHIDSLSPGMRESREISLSLPGNPNEHSVEVQIVRNNAVIDTKKVDVELSVPKMNLKLNKDEQNGKIYQAMIFDNRNNPAREIEVDFSINKDKETYFMESGKKYSVGNNELFQKVDYLLANNLPPGEYEVNSAYYEEGKKIGEVTSFVVLEGNRKIFNMKYLFYALLAGIVIVSGFIFIKSLKKEG